MRLAPSPRGRAAVSEPGIKVTMAGNDVTRRLQFRMYGLQQMIIEPAPGFAFTPSCLCGTATPTVVGIRGTPYRCACGRPWRWRGDGDSGGHWQTDAREWPDAAEFEKRRKHDPSGHDCRGGLQGEVHPI